MLFLHLCLWAILQKIKWNVASARHQPFSICQANFLVFSPEIPAGYQKTIGKNRALPSGSQAAHSAPRV